MAAMPAPLFPSHLLPRRIVWLDGPNMKTINAEVNIAAPVRKVM